MKWRVEVRRWGKVELREEGIISSVL